MKWTRRQWIKAAGLMPLQKTTGGGPQVRDPAVSSGPPPTLPDKASFPDPLLTPLDSTSPIVTCVAKNAERLAPAFNTANIRITTRWNHIRIGTSVFNDMEDVERLLVALPKPS
jgi:hypothetical protein